MERIVGHFAPDLATVLPPIRLIEAFRQIRPAENQENELGNYGGLGLVERLEQLERPSLGRSSDTEKFRQINEFVRFVLEDPSATLSIPHDAKTVLVERGDDLLALDSLGTGVHQVVLLAAAATILENHVVCIEEPEVHLHPLLQRRLVRYLNEHTSNQYLIATHSAHMLDHGAGSVFHLTHSSRNGTTVEHAGTPNALARLCADLGYRPSDLLQANAIIWVEGPSDRIYVRHWLNLLSSRPLIESIDYSIMFYGGNLLSHLSPNDPHLGGLSEDERERDVEDFISLRRLNRHLAVIIDSDKRSSHGQINATKKRVQRAFEESPGQGFAWITKGYTIENYIPRQLLDEAVAMVHPRSVNEAKPGPYEPPLRLVPKRHRKRSEPQRESPADKTAIAKYVCEHWRPEDLRTMGLQFQVKRLIALIEEANGRPGT